MEIKVSEPSDNQQFRIITADSTPLFEDGSLVTTLKKGLIPSPGGSSVGVNLGRAPHPILMANAIALMTSVNIQQTCIQTKRDATVGLGFETEEDRQKRAQQQELDARQHDIAMGRTKPEAPSPAKPVGKADAPGSTPPGKKGPIEEALDPLCEHGFQSLMNQVGEDYENTGNGYIEVVRDGTEIIALWHMPAPSVHVVVEETKPNFHFEVDGIGGTLKLARFGDVEGLRSRVQFTQTQVTELIHFKQFTSLNRYYGMPSWVACVPWLELAQMIMQYHFDYFQNRAVPDLMVLMTGQKVPQPDLESFKASLKETVGAGKRHRTIVGAFPSPDLKVQVERLNSDNREGFQDLWSTVQLQIVSSHRVPPLLAGVTLPGKMAAANELPNALIAFQTLYVDQHQKIISLTLQETLGNQELSGLPLQPEMFKFKKVTDYYDMGQVDTMSRMRETAVDAQTQGRKLSDGLKK